MEGALWIRALARVMLIPLVTVSARMRGAIWSLRLKAFGEGARIYSRAQIYHPRCVSIGASVVINDFVHIWGAGGVTIGDNSLLAAGCVVTSQSHDVGALSAGKLYGETSADAPVFIGQNVWLGSGAIILPGVSIGDNSIVGAGSIVTRDLPAAVLAVGAPARIVRRLE